MAVHLEHPSSDEQVEAWAEIMWRVDGLRIEVDEFRHNFEQDTESLWALAYLGGEPAGIGVGRPSSLAGANYAAARVLPELRGRGVGSALLDAIAEHARAGGATELYGRIRADDEATLAFAERRGFREVGREHDVMLELSKVPPAAPDPPSGITLVTFAERPDLIPAVFGVDTEVSLDVPTHGSQKPMTYERWARENLEGPGAFPEACVIALAGDEVVGYTALRRYGAGSPEAENRLTAVRRPWRRRGIATALKRTQIEAAHGWDRDDLDNERRAERRHARRQRAPRLRARARASRRQRPSPAVNALSWCLAPRQGSEGGTRGFASRPACRNGTCPGARHPDMSTSQRSGVT